MNQDVPEETIYSRRTEFEVGNLVADRYEIVSLIGEGGMGLVWKAKHVLMNRYVALKMIRSELVSDQTLIQRFQQEARAVSKLHHENIVTVYDFGVTPEGTPYLVMDFLEGVSLADLISERGKIPCDQAMEISIQACRALQHAHDNGIIHRDFKSSNLMICRQGAGFLVKVVDFGMAKLLRPDADNPAVQELTQTGEVFGSPLYMSPEQCRGQQLDERSDIYSLACVMYYALTGTPPFLGENVLDTLQRQIHDDPAPLTSFDRSIPDALEAVIMKALRKNPEDRFHNVTEVLTDLQAVAAGRDRVFQTVQMLKPDLTKKKKAPLFGHNFETNMIVLMMIGAVCIATTAYMTGRFVEVETDEHEQNLWVDHNQAGNKARQHGKFDLAQQHYKAAVTEAMKFGRSDPRLAKSLVSLGAAYIDDKEYARAETQLKRAVSVLEKCYGPNCAENSPVMLMLSRSYQEQGRTKDAAAARKKALALLEGSIKSGAHRRH